MPSFLHMKGNNHNCS